MKSLWKLLCLGLVTYLVFLIATLPASFVFDRLSKRGVQTVAVNGTLWKGQAMGLHVGVLNLGRLQWKLKIWPLFAGRLNADLKLERADGFAETQASAGLSGRRIAFKNLRASLPIDAILGSSGLPGGWKGKAQAKLDELVLENAWPVAAHGTLDMVDLTGPARQPANIGNYRVTFPASASDQTAGLPGLTGSLQDLQAPISVAGTVTLSPGRNYLLDLKVAARDNAPPAVKNGIQYLGAPDAAGRRPFSISGTL